MKCLNSSYRDACLNCTLSDKELGEYLQQKKRVMELPKKYAVQRVGLQEDGTWVFSSSVHLSSCGQIIEASHSSYIWIGRVYSGAGVASRVDECTITLPLTSNPLQELLQRMKSLLKHNFMPAVMVMASTVMSLHYQQFQKSLHFCPVALAFGDAATGKTTALQCSMALLGALESRFYSKISKPKILQLCATSSIPLAVDDPQSKGDISRLVIDLYNGARNATIAHGTLKPSSTCIIAANFSTTDQQRFVQP